MAKKTWDGWMRLTNAFHLVCDKPGCQKLACYIQPIHGLAYGFLVACQKHKRELTLK